MTGFIYGSALVVGVVILLADLFVMLAGTPPLVKAIWLAQRGIEVTGHVTEAKESPGGIYGVTIAYETPAGKFETGGTSQESRIGQPIKVRYDPAKPARATTWLHPVRRAATAGPVVLAIAALSAGAVTGAVFYFAGIYSSAQVPLTGGSAALALALIITWYAHSQRQTSN